MALKMASSFIDDWMRKYYIRIALCTIGRANAIELGGANIPIREIRNSAHLPACTDAVSLTPRSTGQNAEVRHLVLLADRRARPSRHQTRHARGSARRCHGSLFQRDVITGPLYVSLGVDVRADPRTIHIRILRETRHRRSRLPPPAV